MSENESAPETRFLVDPYKEWVRGEGIPVHEGFGLDLLSLDLAPWARLASQGAFALLTGRGDFVDMPVVELPPGAKTTPHPPLSPAGVYLLPRPRTSPP